jgi:hypothetical protein
VLSILNIALAARKEQINFKFFNHFFIGRPAEGVGMTRDIYIMMRNGVFFYDLYRINSGQKGRGEGD